MSKFSITEAELRSCMFGLESLGICLACGEQTDSVEPDAQGYKCPSCGEWKVMGLEMAMNGEYVDLKMED